MKDLQIDTVLILHPKESDYLCPPKSYTENYATVLENTIIGNSECGDLWSLKWKRIVFVAVLISTSENKIAWYSIGESMGTLDKLLEVDITSWNRIISVASCEPVYKLVSDVFFRKQSK